MRHKVDRQKNGPAEAGAICPLQNEQGALPTLGVVPVVHVLPDLILSVAIALLNLALQLIPLAVDRG